MNYLKWCGIEIPGEENMSKNFLHLFFQVSKLYYWEQIYRSDILIFSSPDIWRSGTNNGIKCFRNETVKFIYKI